MTIPTTATKPSNCRACISPSVPKELWAHFDSLLLRWQTAVNEEHYVQSGFTHPANQVRIAVGSKYARLNIGSSGAMMVELETGIIYGIMEYGKVNKKKILGNAYDPNFDAAVLVRDRFRYGRFENNPDGSLRQPIVRH